MVERLSVRSSDVLYRTRGRDWDYGFLLQPEPLLNEGWYAIHRRIFANLEPDPSPKLLRGALGIGTGHAFLATTFVDAVRRDHQQRPIAHYLTWIGRAAEAAPGLCFGPPLVAALAPALDAIFELVPQAVCRGQTRPLDALLRELFRRELPGELRLECEPASAIRWLGTLAI